MTAAEVLMAERRIDAKVESVKRELFYAGLAWKRLAERVERLTKALPVPPPAAKSKGSEGEKLKSSRPFNFSTVQPFNFSTSKGGEE